MLLLVCTKAEEVVVPVVAADVKVIDPVPFEFIARPMFVSDPEDANWGAVPVALVVKVNPFTAEATPATLNVETAFC